MRADPKKPEDVRAALRAPLTPDEEISIRELLRSGEHSGEWAWEWVAHLLASLDAARGNVTCFECGGAGTPYGKLCGACKGDGVE